MDEVGGDDLIGGVFQNALEIGFGGLFHGRADLLVRGVFGRLDGEVNDADGGRRDAKRHAGEFSLHFGADEADGLGGSGGRGDDVDGAERPPFQSFRDGPSTVFCVAV